MRVFRWLAVAVLVAVPIGVAATSAQAGDGGEVRRIRTHFDSVLAELTTRNVSGLSDAQRTRRTELVRTLEAYRNRGVFPHNYDFPGQFIPYFVDRKTGTLCAVANLLASTGRRDVVDRVAAADNNVWVAQLASDTAFTRWLDANGVTLDEAARIQVPYGMPVNQAQEARQVAFGITAPIALGAAMTTSVWNVLGNRDGHRRAVSWTGVVSGLASMAAGGILIAKQNELGGPAAALGAASAGVGALSIALSTNSIHRHRVIVSAEREAARQREAAAEASIAPIVTGKGAAGVGVSLRF